MAKAKKATTKKKTTTQKTVAAKTPTKVNVAKTVISKGISPQEKWQLIAQAAYLKAEKRGFIPGFENQDWLEAEAEVERRLSRK